MSAESQLLTLGVHRLIRFSKYHHGKPDRSPAVHFVYHFAGVKSESHLYRIVGAFGNDFACFRIRCVTKKFGVILSGNIGSVEADVTLKKLVRFLCDFIVSVELGVRNVYVNVSFDRLADGLATAVALGSVCRLTVESVHGILKSDFCHV